jgi:hypothetical protein
MVWQRLKQFLAAISAHVTLDERVLVVTTLSDSELLLFERMPVFDQRHCLDVYHTLVRNGHNDPHLLRAALIHDCGKLDDAGAPIPLFYYGLFVVLKALAPRLYERAAADGRGPLRRFAVHARHEMRAAALAEALGSPPEVVAILRDYAARNATARSTALHWADEQN